VPHLRGPGGHYDVADDDFSRGLFRPTEHSVYPGNYSGNGGRNLLRNRFDFSRICILINQKSETFLFYFVIKGRGLGSFVGGFLMKFYGTRSTFRILGAAAFFVGLNYFFFNLFYIRRKRLNKEKVDKKTPDELQPDIIGKPDADSSQGLNNPVFVPDDDDVTKAANKKGKF
jgi:hypothetical protein